jgi:hypothetical protein
MTLLKPLFSMQVNLGSMRPYLRSILAFEDLAMGLSSAMHLSRTAAITHLQLRSCEALEVDALVLLLESLPALRSLDFASCSSVDDKALAAIARHSPSSGKPGILQTSLHLLGLEPNEVCLPERHHHLLLLCSTHGVLLQ